MKFQSKTKQTYHRNQPTEFVKAELNYHDHGDYFIIEGRYYVEVDVVEEDEVVGQELVWQEPINRKFARAEVEQLEQAISVNVDNTILQSWDKLKEAASLYELNLTSGFGEWQKV